MNTLYELSGNDVLVDGTHLSLDEQAAYCTQVACNQAELFGKKIVLQHDDSINLPALVFPHLYQTEQGKAV